MPELTLPPSAAGEVTAGALSGRHRAGRPAADDPAELRDQLTVTELASSCALQEATFDPLWWDGAAHVPALVGRLDGRRVRVVDCAGATVVLPVASWRARRALARLRQPDTTETLAPPRPAVARLLNRPVDSIGRSVPLRPSVEVLGGNAAAAAQAAPRIGAAPAGRSAARHPTGPPRVVRVEQHGDVLRCRHGGCGALLPLPAPGAPDDVDDRCPACGRR